MARRARIEPPKGVKPPWSGVWRSAQSQLEAAGTWSPALKPLLEEYVEALRRAKEFRPPAGSDGANIGFIAADRESRRALAIASALGLVPKRPVGRPRKERDAEQDKAVDPFDELDELAPRREKRAQAP